MNQNQEYLEEIRKLLNNHDDWVFSRRYGFSASKLAKRYPEGVPLKLLCEALLMTEKELEDMYEEIVLELQVLMKVNNAK